MPEMLTSLPQCRYRKRRILSPIFVFAAFAVVGFAQIKVAAQTISPVLPASVGERETLVIEGNGETQVFAFGKNVIVKQSVREVFVFGGDAVIEGQVSGDVGTIGGSVIQRRDAVIGGDVIVLGGTYRAEDTTPLRTAGKETVLIGVFEEELRSLAKNPTEVFSPALTWGFFAQRVVSVLFWFLISFVFATISPGAVSRAVARLHISTLKVLAIGFSGFLVMTIGIILSVGLLPGYLSGVVGLMMLFLLFLAYVFGRVAMQASIGKLLQKRFFPEKFQSETVAILVGVVFWTIVLSVPYVWTIALFVLFSVSIGLVFTARSKPKWTEV